MIGHATGWYDNLETQCREYWQGWSYRANAVRRQDLEAGWQSMMYPAPMEPWGYYPDIWRQRGDFQCREMLDNCHLLP